VIATNSNRPRPTDSAKSALLTILGEFVVPNGGSVWTGSLVQGLATLGYSDRNARQAIARLRDDGVIEAERHGRKTQWHATTAGDHLLRTGATRIYEFGQHRDPWDGRWLVVVCSIPETQRDKRRLFQTRLSFAGFGFVTPTVAVSPHVLAEVTANEVIKALDLADLAVVLTAETGSMTPDSTMLERSWDLEVLGQSYQEFVSTFDSVAPTSPEASFTELVRLVHSWRQFPFVDPELPPDLLPANWIGTTARDLFDTSRQRWTTDATSYYLDLETSSL